MTKINSCSPLVSTLLTLWAWGGVVNEVWTKGRTRSFKMINEPMARQGTLKYLTWSKELLVYIGACIFTVGTILGQIRNDNSLHHFSQQDNRAERTQSTIQRGALPMIYRVKKSKQLPFLFLCILPSSFIRCY